MKTHKLSRRVIAFFMTLCMVFGVLAGTNFASIRTEAEEKVTAEELDHSKDLKPNGDGTYTLSLSVTGKASSKSETNKANVVLVFDISGSMNYSNSSFVESETGNYGKIGEEYEQLYRRWGNGYRAIRNNENYTGTVYTVSYSGGGYYSTPTYSEYTGQRYYTASQTRLEIAKEAVSNLVDALAKNNTEAEADMVEIAVVLFSSYASTNEIWYSGDMSSLKTYVDGLSANGGTNWDDGLHEANTLIQAKLAEGDSNYVIFVSDGEPTFYMNQNHTQRYGNGSSTTNNELNAAYTEAEALKNMGVSFYGVGAFGNVTNMQTIAEEKAEGAYYSATDSETLNAAFDEIVNSITNSADFKSVEVMDQMTAMTSTSMKLASVDADSFTYTRSDGKEYDAGKATYDAATEKINWNLGDDYILENNVTYTLSFRVWPSQEAYDLIADLNNGTVKYEDLEQGVKKQVQYDAADGIWYLKTNADNSLDYTQVLTKTSDNKPVLDEDGKDADGYTFVYDNETGKWVGTLEVKPEDPQGFENPKGMALTDTEMKVKKEWDGITPAEDASVEFVLYRDGEPTDTKVTLSASNNWEATIKIAPGIIADGETLETGHTYELVESDNDYRTDFVSEVVHPMLVDGTMVHYADDKFTEKLDDTTLTGTNTRRSVLNITKVVETEDGITAPADALFTYTVKITSADGEDVWFSIGDGSDSVVQDADRVTGATAEKNENGAATGYYFVKSGAEFTAKIKAGENIYVINLPKGSTYEVTEAEMPEGFEFVSADLNEHVRGDASNAVAVENDGAADGKTVQGTIAKSNTQYNAIYTNKYSVDPAKAKIDVEKILDVAKGLTGPTSISGKYTFTLTGANNAPLPAVTSVQNPDAKGGTASFGEIEFTVPGTYVYTITETGSVAGVTNDKEAVKTVTIEVKDNGAGKLYIEGFEVGKVGEKSVTFTNIYDNTEATSESVTVIKILESTVQTGTLPDVTDKFTFTLYNEAGEAIGTVKSGANGAEVAFDAIPYSAPGVYTYTIKETGAMPGVVNDAEAETGKTVTVEVADDGNGKLYIANRIEAVTFTNTFSPAEIGDETQTYISGTKTLNGRDMLPDESFTFTLTADEAAQAAIEAGTVVVKDNATTAAVTGAADGAKTNFSFGTIYFFEEGTYTFSVAEVKGNAAGVAYDESVKTITVTVAEKEGKLVASVEGSADFVNIYSASTAVTPVGTKTLIGSSVTPTAPAETEPAAEETAEETEAADPSEEDESMPAEDSESDAAEEAEETEPAAETPAEETEPAAEPVEINLPMNAGDYTFVITYAQGALAGQTVATGTNAAAAVGETAAIAFGSLTYSTSGDNSLQALVANQTATVVKENGKATYTIPYVVTEQNPAKAAIQGNTQTRSMIVTVVDNGQGSLTASVSGDALEFVNRYTTNTATIEVDGLKTLTGGRALAAGEFTFTISGDGPLPENTTATNEAGGAIHFGQINYSVADLGGEARRTFTYTVNESGRYPGVTNDTEKTFTVTVTDNGDGTLSAVAAPQTTLFTFVNTYAPVPATSSVTVAKQLEGRALAEGEFTFVISANTEGAPLPAETAAANAADGTVTFGEFTFNQPGTYSYKIVELAGNADTITYDETEYYVTAVVTDNFDGEPLNVEWTGDDAVIFRNFYQPNPGTVVINGTKVLEGADLAAGQFSFLIFDEDGEQVGTATNDATGAFSFEFEYEEAGIYTYTVKEVNTGMENMTYDESVKTVIVTVTDEDGQLSAAVSGDELKFVNTYVEPTTKPTTEPTETTPEETKPEVPHTGDTADMMPWVILMAAAVVAMIGMVVLRKRVVK